MARYRKTSFIEDLLIIASKLPWWLSLSLGALFYFWLHGVAIKPIAMGSRPDQYADMLAGSAFKAIAGLFQYVLPVVFGVGAIVSVMGRYKRSLRNVWNLLPQLRKSRQPLRRLAPPLPARSAARQ